MADDTSSIWWQAVKKVRDIAVNVVEKKAEDELTAQFEQKFQPLLKLLEDPKARRAFDKAFKEAADTFTGEMELEADERELRKEIVDLLRHTTRKEVSVASREVIQRYVLASDPDRSTLDWWIQRELAGKKFVVGEKAYSQEQVTPQLDIFFQELNRAFWNQPLFRDQASQKETKELLVDIRELLQQEIDIEEMRFAYLVSLRQRFEYLDLGGIAPRVQNRTVKLRMEDVFVPVQARPELETYAGDISEERFARTITFGAQQATMFVNYGTANSEEIPELEDDQELALRELARREQPAEAKPLDIRDLLRHSRLVILGDPGSGKSTLVRHVAYAVATGNAEAVGERLLERVPIYVRIVNYSQAQLDDPPLTLDGYIRDKLEPRWAALFQDALDSGRALLLLDGLDEVVDAHQRGNIADAIHTLAADYPGNVTLVTSRIVGYRAARLSGDFAHHTIRGLPPERIAEFIEKWYEAIEREAGQDELDEEIREWAQTLSDTIKAQPGIQRLARNPLLLTIIALVNWKGRKLPNRRVELYAHAAETLIESWPYRRLGEKIDTERVIRLLSPVAYRIFSNRSAGDIAEDEVLPLLSEAIRRIDGVAQWEAKGEADDFLGQISERSGIFRERGYDERGRRVFGFLHLTFAEYFVALHLASQWEGLGEDGEARRTFLRPYAHHPRWREVVLLMVGDVGLRDNKQFERATRLVSDILTLGSDYEALLHRDLLLAGECLADDLAVQPRAANYILAELVKLIAKPGLANALQNLFHAMRGTVYQSRAVKGLLARLEEGESESMRGSAALALGQLGLGGEQVVYNLLKRLGQDESKDVRYSATVALGKLGDVRAVAELLVRLEQDESAGVRMGAATALGRLGDEQAIAGLLARLEYDEDRRVRISAAVALGGVGDERAVDGLLACVEHDEVVSVRRSAAEALGRLGETRVISIACWHA